MRDDVREADVMRDSYSLRKVIVSGHMLHVQLQ